MKYINSDADIKYLFYSKATQAEVPKRQWGISYTAMCIFMYSIEPLCYCRKSWCTKKKIKSLM